MQTSYFVELPKDRFGNTTVPKAVVEARIEADDRLIPIAPYPYNYAYPRGWHMRDCANCGRWIEVEGPARTLSDEEHQALVASIPS